jgi:hypothetical protein
MNRWKTRGGGTTVLRHLDDHLLRASIEKGLNRKEIKDVARRILEALSVLHPDGYIHTGEILLALFTYITLTILKILNPIMSLSIIAMMKTMFAFLTSNWEMLAGLIHKKANGPDQERLWYSSLE